MLIRYKNKHTYIYIYKQHYDTTDPLSQNSLTVSLLTTVDLSQEIMSFT